ncbi:MAG TPA: efflux RND transporter periplasmic adaptor subunit, partial [Vicinamibacteria bacterium]|nr:efflux RND transporter periplasmic adaptor subunit [Vicinamibacteria bacterium]
MRTHPAVLVLLPAAALMAACGSSASSAPAARPLLVRTAPVQARDIPQHLVLTGTLRPRAQVQVVAEVGGRLVKVVRDEGAPVRAGELLAQIDPTDYQLSTQRARAALAVAEANRAHAVVEKERADNLVRTGGITDKDHLAAQVGLQVAEAALSQARADAAIAGQQLARAAVRAPFNGRVARRMADAGAMLAAGAPLFTVVDDSVLEFRASVPSADYGKVTVGAPVEVAVDGRPDGTRVRGRVARVTPLVDERTRSFEAVVEVPGGPGLVGGVFARASVRFGELKGALVVPPSALVRSGGSAEAQVFLVKD